MPVIIYPHTGTVRSFKNYDLACLWLGERPDQVNKLLFTCPEDFNRWGNMHRVVAYPQLESWTWWRWSIVKKTPRPMVLLADFTTMARIEQNKYLWHITNHIADPVTVSPSWMGGQGVTVDLELCRELLKQKEWVMMDLRVPDFPPRSRRPAPQLLEIVKLLESEDRAYMTEDQIEELMHSYTARKSLVTKQDQWRIFRYYRPILEQTRIIR